MERYRELSEILPEEVETFQKMSYNKICEMHNGKVAIPTLLKAKSVRCYLRTGHTIDLEKLSSTERKTVFGSDVALNVTFLILNPSYYYDARTLCKISKMIRTDKYWTPFQPTQQLSMTLYDLFFFKLKSYRDLYKDDPEKVHRYDCMKGEFEPPMDKAYFEGCNREWAEDLADYVSDGLSRNTPLIETLELA